MGHNMKIICSLLIVFGFICSVAYASYIIPNGSVTNAKIANNAVTAAKIANATITTTQISGSAAITGSQIASSTVAPSNLSSITDGSTLDQSGSGSKLEVISGGINTTQLANGSVTQAKRAALNIVTGSSCGAFTGTASAITPVTSLSVSITTTGRPVTVCMQGDSTGSSFVGPTSSNTAPTMALYLIRDSSVNLTSFTYQNNVVNAGTSGVSMSVPSIGCYLDTGASAATHTYNISYIAGSGAIAQVSHYVLIAYEL